MVNVWTFDGEMGLIVPAIDPNKSKKLADTKRRHTVSAIWWETTRSDLCLIYFFGDVQCDLCVKPYVFSFKKLRNPVSFLDLCGLSSVVWTYCRG